MILIIDNYDSFVFNIARYVERLGVPTRVVRDDAMTIGEVEAMRPRAIIISPGPCTPAEAGISLDLVRALSGRLPILGICLGHQCIGAAFGGTVERAIEPMHGRASLIRHDGSLPFAGLPETIEVGRYHSLIVRLPRTSPLVASAWSTAGEIMALRHGSHPTFGVQFHPESILTPDGPRMIANFLDLVR